MQTQMSMVCEAMAAGNQNTKEMMDWLSVHYPHSKIASNAPQVSNYITKEKKKLREGTGLATKPAKSDAITLLLELNSWVMSKGGIEKVDLLLEDICWVTSRFGGLDGLTHALTQLRTLKEHFATPPAAH